MSTLVTDDDHESVSIACIKLEHDSNDELIGQSSSDTYNMGKYSLSTANMINLSSMPAYKGKIEVTSKGRRKIFDGIRWQILCRRSGTMIVLLDNDK
jgi:hypothetical protein